MHTNTYLDQQQTEKTETEVRDVDRLRITKVYVCCPGWPSGGVTRALQSEINIYSPPAFSSPLITEDLPGRAAAGVYFNNRYFPPPKRVTVCYLPLPGRPGRKAVRVMGLDRQVHWVYGSVPHVFGTPGSGSFSQTYGSGSFPFLINVLSRLI
jgi:hypothetical protein